MKRLCTAVLATALAAGAPLFALQEAAPKPQEKPKESRTAYVRRLFEKDRATYGDASRAVLSLAAGDHTDAAADAVQKDLVERGIVDPGWAVSEDSLLTRGTLAYMLCKALGIKGGLTIAIFGMTRRYALRECIHLTLISGGTSGEYVSGRELLDVMANAEIYKEQGSLDSVRK